MTFWSGERLSKDGAAQKIVEDFDPSRIDCNAYELTLGPEAYVSPGAKDNLSDHAKKQLQKAVPVTICGRTMERGGGSVTIPPGQFAFLLTEEAVQIPRDAMGFISLKFGVKAKGLINVSGFHVDPGYCGNLVFSVFNGGPTPITLTRGERLFLLWIADLSEGDPKSNKYVKSGFGQHDISSDLISKISKNNYSLQALSEELELVKKEFYNIKVGAAATVTAVTIVIALLSVPIRDFFAKENPKENISSQVPSADPSVKSKPDRLRS